MRKKAILVLTLLPLAILLALGQAGASDKDERAAIQELIEKTYVNGAFNALDPDAMRRGFHPDFAIFSPDGEDISKYPIGTWADGVAKRKASADFDPEKNRWNHRFVSVDITGRSAAVKIELSHEGELVYTDYLTLLKFDSGWRIVGKVYHGHRD